MSISCTLYKIPFRKDLLYGRSSVIVRNFKQHPGRSKLPLKHHFQRITVEEEYSAEPNYPPIEDLSPEGIKARKIQEWCDDIQKLGTIEEKMIKLNMPRFYGWYCHMVNEGQIPFNSMKFAQHVTRTHFINDLPAVYKTQEMEETAKECLNQVKSQVMEALLFEMQRELPIESVEDVDPQDIERARSLAVSEQINTVILSQLGRHIPHLQQAQADPEPRIEAGWVAGGMELVNEWEDIIRIEMEHEKEEDDQEDSYIQYIGKPLLQLRSELPLKPFIDAAECENPELEVPEFTLCPKVLDTPMKRRFLTNIPGFWPNENHQFGLMSFLSRSHIKDRPPHFGPDEHLEALHTQAMFASYSWLHSQACYLGFSTYNDVTYPLSTQTVITDGQLWSVYGYQLNTTLLHTNHTKINPKRNICWGSTPLKLYERIEDGKIIGFNDDVLSTLLKLYANAPAERKNVEMTPYLNSSCRSVANIEDEERRDFLEKAFKFVMSNRPRHKLLPEYYMWEQIYKIKFQTRPMDARRRPFELWQNPWKRRLDDHPRLYIPKAIRKDPKKRFRTVYYP